MPDGFVTLASGRSQATRDEVRQRHEELSSAATERGDTPDTSARRALFDAGDDPLPGQQSPSTMRDLESISTAPVLRSAGTARARRARRPPAPRGGGLAA